MAGDAPKKRRIDALYCSKGSAGTQIRAIIQEIQQKASKARLEVRDAIAERIQVLQSREQSLMAQIDSLRDRKTAVLEKQMYMIEQGTCPAAPSEDPEKEADSLYHLLDADPIIVFRKGEEDFLDKIVSFGAIDEESTYASKSYAKGPALGIMKQHNPSQLWVFGCNRTGERRKEGGDNISCKLSSESEFDPVEVEDLQDGRYSMKLIPRNAGNYKLTIAVGPEGQEEEIAGSPFQLVVRAPTDYASLGGVPGAEEPHGKVRIGEAGEKHVADSIGLVHHPCGIVFDHTGRYLFVADQSNHRIQAFDTKQRHEAVCTFGKKGFGPRALDTPNAVCSDRENRIVVSDQLNHRLQVLEFLPRSKEIRHVRTVGSQGQGPGQFMFPKGMCMTENGHLVVCDFGNHRVQLLDVADGFKVVREWGTKGTDEGQFNNPLDVTVNCAGEILVSDMNNRIQMFDTQGKFLRMFGKRGRKDGEFNYPVSIITNDENALFVCDQGNHRMQVFHASDGEFIHKWGGTKNKKVAEEDPEGENADKPPEPQWKGLRGPAGVAVNADGSVVVSDYQTHAIYAF